jgi:hypothetical protein
MARWRIDVSAPSKEQALTIQPARSFADFDD